MKLAQVRYFKCLHILNKKSEFCREEQNKCCTTVVAGRHIGHNVQEDHGVVPAVALSHEVDKVAAHILSVNEKMCLLM